MNFDTAIIHLDDLIDELEELRWSADEDELIFIEEQIEILLGIRDSLVDPSSIIADEWRDDYFDERN